MTACVAIAPDSRMDNSGTCVDSLHGCLADDLDPSFGSAVGLLKKVDVLSTYMTAAAESAVEREDRVSVKPSASRDSAQVDTKDKATCGTLENSGGISSSLENWNVSAERDSQPVVSFAPQDLGELDAKVEAHAIALSEISKEFSPRMELKVTTVDEPAALPLVLKQAEEKEKSMSTDVALELKQEQTKDGDLAKYATAEVSDVGNPKKEEAEVAVAKDEAEKFTDGVDIAKNVDFGSNEVKFEVTETAVMRNENIDGHDSFIENWGLSMHADSDSTTTTTSITNPMIESVDPREELMMRVLECSTTSAVSADLEDAITEREMNLTESLANLAKSSPFQFTGLNHIAFCCESLERSLDFYCGLLGLKINLDRPDLPYRGAWLLLGAEGIHIMEVPNPDPVKGRPPHGGYDRHACLNVKNVHHLRMIFDKAGINYQESIVPSIFCRDPDGNGLEFIEVKDVHVD